MKDLVSIVVPVYNRPEELHELLESLAAQRTNRPFEVVVVEDGSVRDASHVVESFKPKLSLRYFSKPNTGPGDSRNFGMDRASGTFFVLVDSDCIVPPDYLEVLFAHLDTCQTDCLGGRDTAHPSFSPLQKAISFCMTSALTTGGLRGGNRQTDDFQPRSFNMGLSADAFRASGGFRDIHPGEDPDLSLRLRDLGFRTHYLPQWVVFHKRRITLSSFFRQVFKFGLARPVLNRWHPGSGRLSYWLPTLFTLGLLIAFFLPLLGLGTASLIPLACYGLYLVLLACSALFATGSPGVALLVLPATLIQFTGYGLGFLKSQTLLTFSHKNPRVLLPGLFFKR